MTTQTARKQIKMVIYKPGETHIQDMLIEGLDGVFRTQCRQLTLQEYIKEQGGEFIAIPFDDACQAIEKLNDLRLINPFKEVTEEQYNYALEVLPPQKWLDVEGVNIFRMSEYTTSNITAHYASYNGKYYFAERRTSTPYAEMAQEIKSL